MDFARVENRDLYNMCVQGDEAAWTYVFHYVLCIARSPRWRLVDTPEDTAQSILCHLLNKGIDRVKDAGAFRGFIRRLAINWILDSFKSRRPRTVSLDEDPNTGTGMARRMASVNPGPEEVAMGRSLVQAIRAAMEHLSATCRRVLSAYVDYKMGRFPDYKALAARFGTSIGSLSSRIKRCLDQLKRMPEVGAWLT